MFNKSKTRQQRANKLTAERAKRSDKQQLERLNKMFGKNNGAKKERAQLETKEH